MASLNKALLIGHLGRDPETRYTTNGDAVTTLNLATSEVWKDKAGEKQERTEWHRVTLFGRMVENAGEFLKKGSLVYIEGKIQTDKYKDKDGVEKYATKIIALAMQFLDKKGAAVGERQAAENPNGEPATTTAGAPAAAKSTKHVDDFDDDIPF